MAPWVNEHAKPRRVAVVGGGWAGLSAAVALVDAGAQVTVFEASRTWGGRARRVELEGCALDNGQHIFVGAYRETLRLMRLVNPDVDKQLLRMPLRLEMNDGLRIAAPDWPAPLGLAYGLLRARGLSWMERFRAISFLRRMRRARFKLPADETAESLLAREEQTGTLRESVWEPLCVAALNTPLAHASAQIFLNVLRDTLGAGTGASDLLLACGNLGRLYPEPAARYLEVHGADLRLGVQVQRLQPDAQGIGVNGEHFDAAILAVGPQHAADLLPASSDFNRLRALLAIFRYEPIHTCYLRYDEEASLSAPMLGFRARTVQWAFDRGALDATPGLIAAVISGGGAHEEMNREALIETVQRELAPHLRKPGSLHWARMIAEKRATYSCVPGLQRPDNRTPLSTLCLAGDYTISDYPATLEAAVRSGQRAAALLV
jgi:hydroxysqualene dehydroxylase